MREGVAWSDEELRAAVEIYLFMLRLQHAGYRLSENELIPLVSSGPLGGRNQASIRYRLRNISSVLADRDLPTLKAFSPAPQVGRGVRTKLEGMLFSDHRGVPLTSGDDGTHGAEVASPDEALANAENAMREALRALRRLDADDKRIGHNQPPEMTESPIVEDLRNAIAVVAASRAELAAARPTKDGAKRVARSLAEFGVRAASWTAQRLTKATDTALSTAAKVGVIALLATLPPIAHAIEALVKLIP
jgi:hypothetical protein